LFGGTLTQGKSISHNKTQRQPKAVFFRVLCQLGNCTLNHLLGGGVWHSTVMGEDHLPEQTTNFKTMPYTKLVVKLNVTKAQANKVDELGFTAHENLWNDKLHRALHSALSDEHGLCRATFNMTENGGTIRMDDSPSGTTATISKVLIEHSWPGTMAWKLHSTSCDGLDLPGKVLVDCSYHSLAK